MYIVYHYNAMIQVMITKHNKIGNKNDRKSKFEQI